MKTRVGFLLTAVLLFSSFVGIGSAHDGHDPNVVIVKIENLKFVPEVITVKPGTTIQWINLDPIDHDVTSGTSIIGRASRDLKKTKFPDGKFQSGLFKKGQTFSVTVEEKGEQPYYCNAHPFMIGKIVVE